MEDVLAVYTSPHDANRPLVCLDETSKQLTAETRAPRPMEPGRPARHDYEYQRNGTANPFMPFAPLEGWRHITLTARPSITPTCSSRCAMSIFPRPRPSFWFRTT